MRHNFEAAVWEFLVCAFSLAKILEDCFHYDVDLSIMAWSVSLEFVEKYATYCLGYFRSNQQAYFCRTSLQLQLATESLLPTTSKTSLRTERL